MKLALRCAVLLVFVAGFYSASFAGQFGPAAKYKIADRATGDSVVLGDFNNDGVLDIALTAQVAGLSGLVFLGNGDGTFQSAKSFFDSGYAVVRGLAAGDFNKDGKLDLAVASADTNGGGLDILLGNGDGTFQSPVFYTAGLFPVAVAVADFNSDGNLDIAVGSPEGAYGNQEQKGGIAVLLGNGDGTFPPYVFYSAGFHPNSPVIASLTGTSVPDIATGTTGSIVAELLGNGDGTFQKAIGNHIGLNPHYLGIGDFNNDGKVDVITTLENTATGQNKVVIALGNGDGTFQSPINLPSPPKAQATEVADFNRDGFADVAIGAPKTPLDGISLLLGKGNATFVHEGDYATGTLVPSAMAVGDLNGDGYPDLVILDGGDSVEVLLNTGTAH